MAKKNESESKKNNNWFEAMRSPHLLAIKKYIHQMLTDAGAPYTKETDQLLARLGNSLVTQDDVESFGHFVVSIYEAGFLKSMEQHKEGLAKLGIEVKPVLPPVQEKGESIFQSEKSG